MASFKQIIGEFANSVSKRMYGLGAEDNADNFRFTEMFGGYREKGDLNTFTGTVYDCVNLISEVVSQYEPEIYKGDNEEEEKQHELLSLIQNPQPNIPAGIRGSDLLYGTEAFILLSGEAFWYLSLGAQTKKPKDIILLNPAKIGISVDKKGNVIGYFTKKDGKPDIPLDIEEIIHLKTFNPKNPYRGLSVIKTHADEIATDDFSGQFTKNFFKNNAGVSGVLALGNNENMISPEAFKKFTQQWRQKYEGVDNAGKTALLRFGEASFTKVGLGLDQLDMTALKKMTKDDILQAFRVPLPLLGKAEGTGLNQGSVDALEYVFAKYNIEPKLDMIDGALQLMIDRYWPDQQLRVEHESTIPENKEFEQKQQMEFLNKVMTVNEVRAQNGLDEVDGGDTLYVETNLLPIGTELQPIAPPSTEGKSIKLTRVTTTKEEQVMVAGKSVSKASVANYRRETERLLAGYTKEVNQALQPIFDDQEKQVLAKVNKSMKKAAEEEELFDEEESNKEMVKVTAPILAGLLLVQGKRATNFAGGDSAKFKVTSEMKKAQEEELLFMAKEFNKNSNVTLNELIAESRALGESKAELKARIETMFEEMKGYRAERLARSETARSGNTAAVDAYKQTGFVTGKQWHTNDPCPYCAEFDGKIIGLDETFAVEGQEIGDGKSTLEVYQDTEEPPLHLNCKCDVLPYREEI